MKGTVLTRTIRSQLIGRVAIFVFASALLHSGPVEAAEYFDWLSDRPESIKNRSYRTQAEIDADIHGQPNRALAYYDANMDACRLVFPKDEGDARQIRPTFEAASNGNLLLVWEARWGGGWSQDGSIGGIKTHKAFQLSDDGNLQMEVRVGYRLGSPPYVGPIDVRPYTQAKRGSGDTLVGRTGDFMVAAETWTRFWLLADFDRDTITLWVADEKRKPVVIYEGTPAAWRYVNQFWFEFDSSQDRVGPELSIWVRNFNALRNVSSPGTIVSAGASVGGSVKQSTSIPKAPVIAGTEA